MGLPVTLSLTNIFSFVSLLSPLFIIFFTIISSIVNNQLVKGLILKNILKTPQHENASIFCNILPAPFTVSSQDRVTVYDNPSLASGVLSFVSTYLIYPMIINNQLNPSILLFLIVLVAINSAVEYHLKCSGLMSSFMGILIGMIFAMIYYTILRLNNNEDLLYFTQRLSDNTQCGRPSDKTFKCTIYKNGVEMN